MMDIVNNTNNKSDMYGLKMSWNDFCQNDSIGNSLDDSCLESFIDNSFLDGLDSSGQMSWNNISFDNCDLKNDRKRPRVEEKEEECVVEEEKVIAKSVKKRKESEPTKVVDIFAVPRTKIILYFFERLNAPKMSTTNWREHSKLCSEIINILLKCSNLMKNKFTKEQMRVAVTVQAFRSSAVKDFPLSLHHPEIYDCIDKVVRSGKCKINPKFL